MITASICKHPCLLWYLWGTIERLCYLDHNVYCCLMHAAALLCLHSVPSGRVMLRTLGSMHTNTTGCMLRRGSSSQVLGT